MFSKKSIVLGGVNDSIKKAVLTLQEEESGLYGMLRLYNFSHEPEGICSLGVYVDKTVYKAGLTLKSHMLYEFFLNIKKLPNKFSAAVVNFQNAEASAILFGSSEGNADNIYANIISEISSKPNIAQTQSLLDEYGVDFDEEEKAEINEQIDKAICEKDCASCVYKNFFFEQKAKQDNAMQADEQVETQKIDLKSEELIQQDQKQDELCAQENQDLFFDRLKPQIDKLFENNPAEQNLQTLIPSSKWVKVEYEDDGDFYVFGLLYDEDGQVKYVCYGVPAVFEENPPPELSGYPIFLPLKDEKGFGYWLTYQDASTGEPVKAVME